LNTKGLKFKIISILALFFLVVFGLLIAFNISEEHANIKKEMERNGSLLANNTLLSIRTPMATGDSESITRTFGDIKKGMKDIDFFVTNPERSVTWSTAPEAVEKDLNQRMYSPALIAAVKKALKDGVIPEKGFEETIEGKPFLSVVQPIPNEKSCHECHDAGTPVLGVFMSRQSTEEIYELLKKLTVKNIIIGVLGFFLIMGSLYFLIGKLVVNPILQVDNVLKDIAEGEGDLTARLHVNRKDEVGELSVWFNTFVEKLQDIIKQVAESARDFAEVTESIAEESIDLAHRNTEQATTITETTATMEEFSRGLLETMEGAETVNKEVETFHREISEKQDLIANVTGTMEVISESSRKINNIIDVINDISFQTNLLALNAAVEAARAGEAGRGFAVVAAEVRTLAQRTTEASKNIQEIVHHNVEYTETGMKLVAETSAFFGSLLKMMEEILSKIQTISQGTREQSTAVEQVNSTVMHLDEAINRNAALSEELSANTSHMKSNSKQLAKLMAQFKV
jgi:methyl-accepting chemotaxis protein